MSVAPPEVVPAPFNARDPLDRVRGLIRRYVVLDGALTAGFVAVFAGLASAALDLGLFHTAGVDLVLDAPPALRAVLLALAVVAVGGVLGFLVVARSATRFSDQAVALLLEKRFPRTLGDRLITAVELADEQKAAAAGYSLALIRRTVAEAAERVARVPVGEVFDWSRLRQKAVQLALVVLCVGLFLGMVVGVGGPGMRTRVGDTAAVWAERNLLVMHTPWPRSSYLEVLTPEPAELRVARDAPPPAVRVRAAGYVIADRAAHLGWRPLKWADLPGLGVPAPEVIDVATGGDFTLSGSGPAALIGAAGAVVSRPRQVSAVSLLERTADEVAQAHGTDHAALATTFAALTELADQSRMSRTLRRLDAPDAVTLRYAGYAADPRAAGSTRGEVKLAREPNGEYAAELAGLKESVSYTVRTRDFRTDPRRVVLVPPPMLMRLYRTERQPAYLHHAPPVDEPGVLARLKQLMPDKDLSLTGERSVCAVPAGTELDLVGTADKPLEAVSVVPRAGRVPATAEVRGDTFTLRFNGPDALVADAAFDLLLVDADGVTSRRPVLIQVTPDQLPQVDIAIEGLRKSGNGVICTPRALAPLIKESIVRDDSGLAAAEFQFTATRLESAAVVSLQVQAAAGAVAVAPLGGALGAAFHPVALALVGRQLGAGELTQSATLPVPPFVRVTENRPGGRPPQTAAALVALTGQPLTPGPGVLKDLKFGLEGDAFDLDAADAVLERRGKRMRVADTADTQPRFRVEVSLVATDTNVFAGAKQGRNLEPLRFLVVPEADLLAEVTKDEEIQTGKFDEALKRLRDAQSKLAQVADRLVSGAVPADVLLAGRVRAEDVVQDAAKGRDLLVNVAAEYARLAREVRLNRCDESVPRRYESAVITPIEAVLAAEYKSAEDALAAFRDGFANGRPADPLAPQARSALAALITRLESIRVDLGRSLSEGVLRDNLRKIIVEQAEVTRALKDLKEKNRDRLFAPELAAVPPVAVGRGATVTVKQTINWNVFDKDELVIRFVGPPGGEVQVPGETLVKVEGAERQDYEFKLTAGAKPGEYPVRIVPSVGPAVVVTVVVR